MNVMQYPGTDLTYGTVPGAPAHILTFFGLHLYLTEKYCKNPKVPVAQLNVNPARAITWLVEWYIFQLQFTSTSRQFLCNKTLLKKTSYSEWNAH